MTTREVKLSALDSTLLEIQNNLFTDLFGPKILKLRYIINTFKGLTFAWVLLLMYAYNNFSTGMYLYLVLHGSYGMFWVMKDVMFPDSRWERKASIGSSIATFLFLTLYWFIPVPLAAGLGISQPSTARIVFLLCLYAGGLVLMLGSDYQKYHALKQKPGLISTGFFKLTRNPNYLGQIMIYSSFVLCSGHVLGCIVLYGLACSLFALNMYLKDKTSYELKKGWDQYRQQSYMLLPKIFSSFAANFMLYAVILSAMAVFLWQEHPNTFTDFSYLNNPQNFSQQSL